MVEEKISIENEIYELCEEISRINSDSIKKLKKVEEEKTVFINNKIRKIIKYINNSELTFEMSSTKILLKEKLNSILLAEKTISQILNDEPENISEIGKRMDSIINTIKELEPIVNSIVDVSVYMARDGIKNSIQLYKRELKNLTTEIEELKNKTTDEFKKIKENDDNELEIISKKQEETQNNINDQIVEFNAKISELQNTIDLKNEELESLKDSYNKTLVDIQQNYENKIMSLESQATDDFDKIKEDISKKDAKISELIGIIGNKANVGEYKTNADKAHTERVRWQIATVVIFGIAFVMMGLITLLTKDYNITTLARYVVSVILLGMSGYTAKQASNQRKDEIYFRKQQLELASIDIYLDDMPDDIKVEIKKELSNKIFGQAGETYKNKYDDSSNETIDKISKIIENMANVITKNNR
ncbi:MAG: hypothetical protein MSH48_06330 [Mollicutes bacterium]|nr:hypothetical protein [Mollicutes bacterium]